jgi:hypothetical protein
MVCYGSGNISSADGWMILPFSPSEEYDYTCRITEDYDYDVQDVLGLNVNPVPEKNRKKMDKF